MVGRIYQVKRRQRKTNKKGGEKRMGGKIGRKKKGRKKKGKRKKKGEVNKTKGKKGRRKVGGVGRSMKNKEKERKKSWDQGFTKGSTMLGLNPVHWYNYIDILLPLVMMAQWLVHLLHNLQVGDQIPVVARAFFSHKYFLPSLSTHQFGRILSGDATPT